MRGGKRKRGRPNSKSEEHDDGKVAPHGTHRCDLAKPTTFPRLLPRTNQEVVVLDDNGNSSSDDNVPLETLKKHKRGTHINPPTAACRTPVLVHARCSEHTRLVALVAPSARLARGPSGRAPVQCHRHLLTALNDVVPCG